MRMPGRLALRLGRWTSPRMDLRVALLILLALTALVGCSTRPVTVRPARALEAALADPVVAAWHEGHSAPKVLEDLPTAAAMGLQRYRPVAMVDLGEEGLLVRFDSALGPRPRRLEVTVDRESGQVLQVKQR